MKKMLSLTLALCLIFVLTFPVNAAELNVVSSGGIEPNYVDRSMEAENIDTYIEKAEIDNIEYTFQVSCVNGETITNIWDEENNLQTVRYIPDEGVILLDGQQIAIVEEEITDNAKVLLGNSFTTYASSEWSYVGSSNHKVSWAKATTVAVVAAAIAAVLPCLGPAGVIAAMGSASISALAASCIGGTVYASVYERLLYGNYNLKTNWYFKASDGTRLPKSGTYTRVD